MVLAASLSCNGCSRLIAQQLAEQYRVTIQHLRPLDQDRAVVDLRGMAAVRRHAEELIERRLAPAEPLGDGRQTPYRGHPVFVAQHATATCCRTCLERWHDIPKGRELDPAERDYVLDVIERWLERELSRP